MSPPIRLSGVLLSEHENLSGDPLPPLGGTTEEEVLATLFPLLHQTPRSALCLSGGGIRSATFALGVVESLARHGLLHCFDYLSTVSGGGYLGGWLNGWIHRHEDGEEGVSADLAQSGKEGSPIEPAPVQHLREYSNYLSPKVGLLSADTWTLAATYLRNLSLNWLLLVPVLLAALAFPRLCLAVVNMDAQPGVCDAVLVLGFLLAVVAVTYIGINRPSAPGVADRMNGPVPSAANKHVTAENTKSSSTARRRSPKADQKEFLLWCLFPLLGATACQTTYWTWYIRIPRATSAWSVVLFMVAVHIVSWIVYSARNKRFRPAELAVVIVTGALAGILAYAFSNAHGDRLLYAWFAAPALLAVFLAAGTLFVGLSSRWMADQDREWAARMGAWVLISATAWLLGAAIVFEGPVWLAALSRRAAAAVAAAGGLSGLVTIVVGWSGKSLAGGKEATTWQAKLATRAPSLAAPVFVAFLAVVLTELGDVLLKGISRVISAYAPAEFSRATALPGGDLNHATVVMASSPSLVLLFMALMAGVALIFSSFINVNKFSLHGMYRNRLIRAYLGASRRDDARTPDPFTGFDPKDNVRIGKLWPKNAVGVERRRLFPVVNCALNLVRGARLAWQERKAESFTATPLHCGSSALGYFRPSAEYGQDKEGEAISLGTAVAISGAAASPNMGYHSSPVVTFLMTLFNARLGWWLGNPGPAGDRTFAKSCPDQAAEPLFQEALGMTDDSNPYIYLSDGGHFENLALYEMVLRRCHLILVSDAGCDPDCTFEDLGNAIRKIRVDLGIPITFPDLPILESGGTRSLRGGCALGRIDYAAADGPGAPPGTLLYLKPSLGGDVPVDVWSYAKGSPSFPHETTADQWFAEAQFESYRALGGAIADRSLAGLGSQFAQKVARISVSRSRS